MVNDDFDPAVFGGLLDDVEPATAMAAAMPDAETSVPTTGTFVPRVVAACVVIALLLLWLAH